MITDTNDPLRILRFPDVVNKTGLSKSALRAQIRSKAFPAPVALGLRAVGFVAGEVDHWVEKKMNQRTEHQGA